MREKGGGEARSGMTNLCSLDTVSCIDTRNGPEGERGQKEGAQVRSKAMVQTSNSRGYSKVVDMQREKEWGQIQGQSVMVVGHGIKRWWRDPG